jgi:hypothetical protein
VISKCLTAFAMQLPVPSASVACLCLLPVKRFVALLRVLVTCNPLHSVGAAAAAADKQSLLEAADLNLLYLMPQGLLWARTQASQRRSALLEKCYIFNCGVIEYLEAHQQDVLLQLEDCAATLFRLMGLQDAKQQAALVRELAAGVLDVCTPWQREEMQVVSKQYCTSARCA